MERILAVLQATGQLIHLLLNAHKQVLIWFIARMPLEFLSNKNRKSKTMLSKYRKLPF